MSPQEQVDRTRNILAYLLVGSFITLIPMLALKAIPEGNKDIIVYMIGQLSGMALLALGLYFSNKAGQEAIDAQKTENTGKLADAVVAAATGGGPSGAAGVAADVVADAAVNAADEIKGAKP